MSGPRRGGLGRGLGALIPTGSAPSWVGAESAGTADGGAPGRVEEQGGDAAVGAYFAAIPLDAVEPNPRQPRQVFDPDALAELVASIREVGLLQPVVVRHHGAGRYQLVMGERRLRAARAAGLGEIPAIVRETADDALLRDALLENLHREQLNPLEEAAAYQQMLDDFGSTHEELAARLGRSRSQVTNTIRLLGLSPPVQRRVAAGVLSAGHARALLGVTDPAEQEALAARIVAEGLSVRAVEELVALGDARTRSSTPRRPAARRRFDAVADALRDRYETTVHVEMGRAKGRVVVEFGSVEDLQRILSLMAPGVPVRAEAAD